MSQSLYPWLLGLGGSKFEAPGGRGKKKGDSGPGRCEGLGGRDHYEGVIVNYVGSFDLLSPKPLLA